MGKEPRPCLEPECETPAGLDLYCDEHYADHTETFWCPNDHSWVDVAAGPCPVCGSSKCFIIEDNGTRVPV